ncbi:hypothetical protein ACQY0O_007016 [Thecaphora frezii]
MEAPRTSKRRRTSSASNDPRTSAEAIRPPPHADRDGYDAATPGAASPLRDIRSPSAYPYSGVRGSPSIAAGPAPTRSPRPPPSSPSSSASSPSSSATGAAASALAAAAAAAAASSSSSSSAATSSRPFGNPASTSIGNLHHYQQHSHSRSQESYAPARSPSASSSLSQLHPQARHRSTSYSTYHPYGHGHATGHGASHAHPPSRFTPGGEASGLQPRPSPGRPYTNSPRASPPPDPEQRGMAPPSVAHGVSVGVGGGAATPMVDHTASSAADSANAAREAPPKKESSNEKPRGGQACLECRLAKVRCLPSADSDNCQRCQRFSFDCLFVQHKRGRKPKSKLQGRDLTLLAEAASATPASAMAAHASSAPAPAADAGGSAGSGIGASATPNRRPRRSDAAASFHAAATAVYPSPATPEVGRSSVPTRAATHERMPSVKSSPYADAGFEWPEVPKRPPRFGVAGAMAAEPDAPPDPKLLYGVDVARMARAMQQAMSSQDRRRGAPYTLVTNDDNGAAVGSAEDDASDAGSPPSPDTNAINESFELIAEQPLTIRLMLKPFEIGDAAPDETLRGIFEDRVAAGAQQREVHIDDPITSGVLTEPAARALFEVFMSEANPWSELFDPCLMTNDFVRKRSSFLYTTLLYVASKFCCTPTAQHLVARQKRGESVEESEWDVAYPAGCAAKTPEAAAEYAHLIRKVLHNEARNHAARAFVDGDRTVLCCQAFFVLASWKMLDDGLSVIQVGYAFRLAMDIQLHADMPNCVKPNDPMLDQASQQRYAAVQRRFRSRQRTFMMLFVQDKAQQIANKINTHSISADNTLIRKCQEWWKYPGTVPGDAFVCASVDIRRIQHKYIELMDRIEQLSGPMSDGPSVVLPAFLNDVAEWFQRWTSNLNVSKDLDEVPFGEDADVDRAKFRRATMKLWGDSLKTYVASLALKWTLKKAAQLEHQEMVRSQMRRSTTAGTEDRESISGRSSILQNGCVNLMSTNAFWPCVEGARGVLESLISLPPHRLRTAPDATVLQSTHAAVLLCSLATLKSNPPLGQGYLRTTIQLVDQASAAFRAASISPDDTSYLIAQYMESLLRPKARRGDAGGGDGKGGSPQRMRRDNGADAAAAAAAAGHPAFASFYATGGGGNSSNNHGGVARNGWSASATDRPPAVSGGHAAQHAAGGHGVDAGHLFYSEGMAGSSGHAVDGGLNTIAAAAAAVAAASASDASAPGASAQMEIGNLTWPSSNPALAPQHQHQHQHQHQQQTQPHHQQQSGWNYTDGYNWSSLFLNPPQPSVLPGQQPTDETLQMLLRFLDG